MSIIHPLKPVYNDKSKILILGSFPSVKSREIGFYYGHPQNRFWKVMSAVTGENIPDTIEDKKQFLIDNHIAVWDVIGECNIEGSSDASISDVTANNLDIILSTANISMIYINGKTAFDLYMKYSYEGVCEKYGRVANAVMLPSTSPANAVMNLDSLIASWMRIKIGLTLSSPIFTLNDYCEAFYKRKLYKLSLDGGFTCPNRDGTIGVNGCIFCDGDGSGAFSGTANSKKRDAIIKSQLAFQKELIKNKLPKEKPYGYIAYFQAFTGTYAPIERLRELYFAAIEDEKVYVLSIATRPDCLSDEVCALLSEINKIKPVWVELGLQTIHKDTAKYIRRGYPLKEYDLALRKLKKIGITQIITHVILGLPNETKKDVCETVRYVGRSQSDGIKLQLLHVLSGTDLETEYANGKISVMDMENYIDTLKACIEELPKDMVIHRLTGDGDKKKLIAPLWSGDKKMVLARINKELFV